MSNICTCVSVLYVSNINILIYNGVSELHSLFMKSPGNAQSVRYLIYFFFNIPYYLTI